MIYLHEALPQDSTQSVDLHSLVAFIHRIAIIKENLSHSLKEAASVLCVRALNKN